MKIVSLAICMFKKNSEKNLSMHLEHAIFTCILLILVGFCNAPLRGLSHLFLDRLQYVQNCSAWLVTRSWSSEDRTDQFFVDYIGDELCSKILLPMYKLLNDMVPNIKLISFSPKILGNYERSSSKNLLLNTRVKSQVLWKQIFSSCCPRLWNTLADNIKSLLLREAFTS